MGSITLRRVHSLGCCWQSSGSEHPTVPPLKEESPQVLPPNCSQTARQAAHSWGFGEECGACRLGVVVGMQGACALPALYIYTYTCAYVRVFPAKGGTQNTEIKAVKYR